MTTDSIGFTIRFLVKQSHCQQMTVISVSDYMNYFHLDKHHMHINLGVTHCIHHPSSLIFIYRIMLVMTMQWLKQRNSLLIYINNFCQNISNNILLNNTKILIILSNHNTYDRYAMCRIKPCCYLM